MWKFWFAFLNSNGEHCSFYLYFCWKIYFWKKKKICLKMCLIFDAWKGKVIQVCDYELKDKRTEQTFCKSKAFWKVFCVTSLLYTHKKRRTNVQENKERSFFMKVREKQLFAMRMWLFADLLFCFQATNISTWLFMCVCVFFRRKCLPLKIITKRKEFSFTWLNIKRIEASHVYQKV